MSAKKRERIVVCRRTTFSSGHRYYNPELSVEQNRAIYGSLFSENGFGHNFTLEAYVEGPVHPETGMVINLKDLDEILKEVTRPLDHHFLNQDVPAFRQVTPTTENIALFCFRELGQRVAERGLLLQKVRLYEGPDLWVDCEIPNYTAEDR